MELSKLTRIFKALSNEHRLQLFLNIHEWEKIVMSQDETCTCCNGIEKVFTKACNSMDLSRSTISHHIKELQNADLITCTRNGQSITCKINDDILDSLKNFVT